MQETTWITRSIGVLVISAAIWLTLALVTGPSSVPFKVASFDGFGLPSIANTNLWVWELNNWQVIAVVKSGKAQQLVLKPTGVGTIRNTEEAMQILQKIDPNWMDITGVVIPGSTPTGVYYKSARGYVAHVGIDNVTVDF